MPLASRNAEPAEPTGDNDYYCPKFFPNFVGRDGNMWDIYANDQGNTAAVAVEGGRRSSHFGDRHHLIHLMSQYPQWVWELSEYGVKFVGEKMLERLFPPEPVPAGDDNTPDEGCGGEYQRQNLSCFL